MASVYCPPKTSPELTEAAPSTTPSHSLSAYLADDLLSQLLTISKPKARSIQTYDHVHHPALEDLSSPIECLLLGDSMFERFKTTGRNTRFGPPIPDVTTALPLSSSPSDSILIGKVTHADDGSAIAAGTDFHSPIAVNVVIPASGSASASAPSSSLYTDPSLTPSYNPHTGIFNAGVGGDSIPNVIHRLTGSDPGSPSNLLIHLLRLKPRHIFLQVGTNDLGDGKTPLSDRSLTQYTLLLRALLVLFLDAKVCVCALNPKRRVKRVDVIARSNERLCEMVSRLNGELRSDYEQEKCSGKRAGELRFLPCDEAIIGHLEDDGVHLNEMGYNIFAQRLSDMYDKMRDDSVSTGIEQLET